MVPVEPTRLKPLGTRLIVRKYELPDQIGSIVVPEAWREDRSLQVFEVVRTTEEANAVLGMTLSEDDIIEMERSWEMVPHPQLPENHFFVRAEDIATVHPWSKGGSDAST